MKRFSKNRTGLVLLVVLGMLALFSLLTVTYMVFASQSKSSSVALSRRYVQGGKPYRPIFEEAIKQLIRGSSDENSELYGQSMLDDLYGSNETSFLASGVGHFQARQRLLLNAGPMSHAFTSLQRPMLLAGRFLRIPVDVPDHANIIQINNNLPVALTPGNPPIEDDVLNGRIITFPQGEGPLSGLSFHIMRYVGNHTTDSDPNTFASSFSITIDLLENDLSQIVTLVVGNGSGQETISGPLATWATRFPQVTSAPFSGPWSAGCYLCYETISLNSNQPLMLDPYQFFINATPLNGHGVGVLADGSNQYHVLSTAGGMDAGINIMPTGLQPRINRLGTNVSAAPVDKLIDPEFNAVTGQFNISAANGLRQMLYGDTDEPIDTPDYNTMFLAFRPANAENSGDIVPSFHRTALINYLVNFKALNTYTEPEFWAVLRRIELATMRPLAMTIQTPNGVPPFMDQSKVVNGAYVSHPEFNPNFASTTGVLGSGIPPLNIAISGAWATNWNTPAGIGQFRAWLNSLMVGKWDVDNMASGIPDSLFIDAGIPLQATPDGKLLKALVAYYVECLDGKLDINAVGGRAQANMFAPGNLYTRPTAIAPTTYAAASPFARGNLDSSGNAIYLNQGMGYGSADISLRHLLTKTYSPPANAELAYQALMNQRYAGSAIGRPGRDAIAQLNLRETRPIHRHGAMPGLPTGVRGRLSIALDRLGNPFIHNESRPVSLDNESEYEARLVSAPFEDMPFTFADWEKIYRLADGDHNAFPARLQQVMGESDPTIASSTLRHEISPRTRHLSVPKLGARSGAFKAANPNIPLNANNVVSPPSSFYQLVNTIRTLKSQLPLPITAFQSLFPSEFQRGRAFDVNRPFGNGVDDDSDGEIDEPVELSQGQFSWDASAPTSISSTVVRLDPLMGQSAAAMNLDPAVAALNPHARYLGAESRQLFARHLYCLAQLLVPIEYNFPSIDRGYWQDLLAKTRDANNTVRINAVQEYLQIRGRILAQWAVNVVDYRDADATMTRFPYDPDPFDMLDFFLQGTGYTNSVAVGWDPSRSLSVDTTPTSTPIHPLSAPLVNPADPTSASMYVAWGMEQPELLLTESLAFHDLRVRRDPLASPTRYDQFRIPQGSLFLELYAPRSTAVHPDPSNTSLPLPAESTQLPGVSPSLYTTTGNAARDVVLDLGRLTPAALPGLPNQIQYPVWRVYLTGPVDKANLTQVEGNRTPNERLVKPVAANITDPASTLRFNLSYQSRVTNGYVNGNLDYSGMVFDATRQVNERIPEPDPATARVILFASPTATFTPSTTNTPGVANDFQIFSNRSGNLQLMGNQYLVVGPRAATFMGSDESSRTSDGGRPGNVPSDNRLELASNWPSMFSLNDTEYRTNGQNVRPAVTMIAAAEAPSTWNTSANPPTITNIGISVSEPLPGASYYQQPSHRVNTNNGSGFENLLADGYFDYGSGSGRTTPLRPMDAGTAGPLALWDKNFGRDSNGTLQPLTLKSDLNSTDPIVAPGTAEDWSTAYLQRLADPEKPWHAALNPYVTVDWIPIDLTVFNGEEVDTIFSPEFDPATQSIRLASRQKSGQTIDPVTQNFVAANNNALGGRSLYSQLTHAPSETTRETSATTFLKYQLAGDDAVFTNNPFVVRPSNCDDKFVGYQRTSTAPVIADNNKPSFTTLGFLNSTFVLAAESGITNIATLPPIYVGAPSDPTRSSATWFPGAPFWANRPFINGFELSYVPTSSPGQIGQEFCATNVASTSQSVYQSAYHKPDGNGYPLDPRMPHTIYSPQVPDQSVNPNPHVTTAEWSSAMLPQWMQSSRPPAIDGVANPNAYYPFMHLLNFFQEAPELQTPEQKYRNTTIFNRTDQFRYRHPKDTSLALLFDMVDTPSAWGDVENHQESGLFDFRNPALLPPEMATVAHASNRILAPFRAPYNKLPKDVEPGRVNLNTTAEHNVLQGLWSNVLTPSDINFPPGAFPQVNDFDHNGNALDEAGGRTIPNSIGAIWTAFVQSRAGYLPISAGGQFYDPPNQTLALNPNWPVRSFNPLFPTHFAGAFKPAGEAGMVPQTRNPIPRPNAVTNAAEADQLALSLHGSQYGLLDFHARLNPSHATLMRSTSSVVLPARTAGVTTGLYEPTTTKLFNDDGSNPQNHPFTDLYPISRLQKLVTERSNVFAVYTTIAMFEFNPANGNIGKEYGVDNGEARRFKAFYIVDRSVPVGFRIGEDHNVENTILVRRILAE